MKRAEDSGGLGGAASKSGPESAFDDGEPGCKSNAGIAPALLILGAWAAHLFYALGFVRVPSLPVVLHLVVQAYLYTGLFITAHDSMHGSVARNPSLNLLIGRIAAFLFAGFSYRRLHRNHMKHHRWPGEERDPDFSVKSQRFLLWFGSFFFRYTTVWQIAIMAVVFNLLRLIFDTANVILFWMVPAFLATLQLFYIGTYRPHRYPHTAPMEPHRARSQRQNHLLAMLSCYFFGYHYEHHASPGTPWWRLYLIKERGWYVSGSRYEPSGRQFKL